MREGHTSEGRKGERKLDVQIARVYFYLFFYFFQIGRNAFDWHNGAAAVMLVVSYRDVACSLLHVALQFRTCSRTAWCYRSVYIAMRILARER